MYMYIVKAPSSGFWEILQLKVLKFESAEKFLLDRHNNFEFTREFKSFVAI